jgi:bla regulator protein blaR1
MIAVLTRGFTRNRPGVRYWLWFSASLKFLVPFSLLVSIGSALPWTATAMPVASDLSGIFAQIGQPFLDSSSFDRIAARPVPDHTGWMTLAVIAIWASGSLGLLRVRFRMWSHIRRALVASTPLDIDHVALPKGARLRAAGGVLEPGVVGLWRPVILVPAGIERYLTPDQLGAVLAHEVCHIRRRDNLFAALHMLVEMVFWFHPMVWWIGSHLIAERERACDEEVLRQHASPRAYAEGIIRVCERYVNTRLACVAGVSGSDLKTRIETIMNHEIAERLSVWKKTVLLSVTTVTVAIPIVIGTFDSARLQAQVQERPGGGGDLAFDSASVKRNLSTAQGRTLNAGAQGWLTATNVTAAQLIRLAYDLPAFQVTGGPAWINSDTFDVAARANGNPSLADKRLMLRRLLAERFSLSTHTETRELPLYALTLARSDRKLGPRLRLSETDCRRAEQPTSVTGVGAPPSGGPPACGYFGFSPNTNLPGGRGGLAFRGLTMPALALQIMPMVRRPVVDDTGLTGYYDADFDFLAELPPPPPPPGMPNPWSEPFVSVLTVLPEQLGLKLDSRRGPVEILVVDRAEPPTEN